MSGTAEPKSDFTINPAQQIVARQVGNQLADCCYEGALLLRYAGLQRPEEAATVIVDRLLRLAAYLAVAIRVDMLGHGEPDLERWTHATRVMFTDAIAQHKADRAAELEGAKAG